MRISVITPTYNAVKFIDQCVKNVCEQGSVVLEHIIVDGGSNDGTLEAAERLAAVHGHIRILRGPDKGQSDAMNKGSEAAVGDIIGLLNVDDYYEYGAPAEAASILSNCTNPTIVIGDCQVIDENGELLWWNKPRHLELERLLQNSPRYSLPANPSAYFYHREVHAIVGGYDINNHFSMDIDFFLRALQKVSSLYVPRHWGNFRLIPGCKSFQNQIDDKDPVSAIMARERRHLTRRQLLHFYIIRYYDRICNKISRIPYFLGLKVDPQKMA